MRRTKFHATFGLYDTTAFKDARYSTDDNSSLGRISNLKTEDYLISNYATLEKNFFVLDGSKEFISDTTIDIGFWSKQMSDANGYFTKNPKLTIDFTINHSSSGLTFYFMEEPPLEMLVTWYTLTGTKLVDMVCYPNSKKFALTKLVENYGKIEVEFLRANPYRYIKLQHIAYGTTFDFGRSEGYSIKGAQLIDSVDTLSDKIASGKLSFSIIDTDYDFNFGNINGIHSVLQYGQECMAYEEVDGEDILLGRYFLTKFSGSNNLVKLEFQDYKGVLADYTFKDGKVYNGEKAGDIIKQIFESANITDYKISTDVYNIPLYGYLKIQDCRKALREVLFACGAIIDTSRKDYISIRKPSTVIENQIKRERKFTTKASTYDYISSVSVKYPVYDLSNDITEVHKATYPKGTYTIDFSTPYVFTGITGATFNTYNQHSVTFTLANAGEVVISGKAYNKEDVTITSNIDSISAGEKEKNVSYNCQVINYDTAKTLSESLLKYLQMRLKINIKFLEEKEIPSTWFEIENEHRDSFDYLACLEEYTLDLTGGFLASAKCRGYNEIEYAFSYASTLPEIYTGSGALI